MPHYMDNPGHEVCLKIKESRFLHSVCKKNEKVFDDRVEPGLKSAARAIRILFADSLKY
jgi:hypothetical protein